MLYTIINIVSTIIVVPLLYLVYKSMTRPKNFPPGPVGLPILGSFFQILPELHIKIPKLAKVYGDIFSLKMSHHNIVCIAGYDLINEVMTERRKEFANRKVTVTAKLCRGEEPNGIAMADYGPKWAAHRKFFHTAFRNMGLNKRGIEKCITDELPAIIQEFEKNCDKETVDPSDMLEYATLNVLASFAFGNRYAYGDEKFKDLLRFNNDFFQKMQVINSPTYFLAMLIPNLHRYWLPDSAKELQSTIQKIRDFAKSEIEHHKKMLDPSSPRDFIDYYLVELNKSENDCLSTDGLEATLMDLFQAGTETTSTTLRWAFLYMANNPDVQVKVHEEIDGVIGLDREPTYEDRLSMPYCEATILEVQRKATITPVGLLHAPGQDTTIRGYYIPKRTQIVPSYHTLHYSPDHWKNPDHFDPENFLDPDGTVGTRDAFMPFGGGLRICIGMALAKQELFLFFVGILQKFKLLLPDRVCDLDEDPIPGLTLAPKPYTLQFKQRH